LIAYRAMLDVPRALAQYVGRLLRAERRERGTRRDSRALTCFHQAVFALRWFRDNRDVTALARDHGISRVTGYRYLDEVIHVLAAQAPDLHEALQQAHNDGATHVILDGKLFSSDRLGEQTISVKSKLIDAWYSGKAHEPGGNIQAVSAPDGFPLWVADVEPGSVHDLTAARAHVLAALYWAASQLDLPNPGRRRLRRGRDRRVHAGQAAIRRPRARRGHPHLQRPATRLALPGRTRIRTAGRPLAHAAPHHRQPTQDRRHRQSRARTHTLRTRPTHLKLAEITSLMTASLICAPSRIR
jgi:hypothetical protein